MHLRLDPASCVVIARLEGRRRQMPTNGVRGADPSRAVRRERELPQKLVQHENWVASTGNVRCGRRAQGKKVTGQSPIGTSGHCASRVFDKRLSKWLAGEAPLGWLRSARRWWTSSPLLRVTSQERARRWSTVTDAAAEARWQCLP